MMTLRRWVLGPVAALALVLGLLGLLSGSGPFAQGQPGCTVTVQPGQSIQKTLDQVSSRAVICLGAGEWKENLVIEKSLTLRAAEIKPEPVVVIKSVKEGWPVILIRSDKPIEVTVIGLKITGAFGECYQYEPEWICADGISVHGQAHVAIKNTTISGNERYGIGIRGSSQATIEGNTISGSEDGIKIEGSSRATIKKNSISGNRWGIEMGNSSQATIEGNTISNNGDGIEMGNSSQATIRDNTISGNRWGIEMGNSSQATIEGNTISNNGDGIVMRDSAQATISNSQVSGNRDDGIIALADSAQMSIENSRVLNNGWGIRLWGSQATIFNSVVSNNSVGISLLNSGQAILINSHVSHNRSGGIRLEDSAQVTIFNSLASDNGEDGIELMDSAQATIFTSLVLGSRVGIRLGSSSQAFISNSLVSANYRAGISLGDSAHVTLENNAIQNNKSCGIWSSSDKPPQGKGNRMWGNGVDLCGNAPATLRIPLVPPTSQTQLSFPGPYRSLQEAIDAIAPGGTITLAAGEYQGGLTIWKPLTLQGAEGTKREEVKIKGAISLISEAQGVQLRRLTITDSAFDGLMLGGTAKATISDSLISDNGHGIFLFDSAQATISNSQVSNNAGHGISVWDSAWTTISNSRILGNGYEGGILLFDSAQATLTDVWISDNAGCGISASSEIISGQGNWIHYNSSDFCGFTPSEGFLRQSPPQPLLEAVEVCPTCQFTEIRQAISAVGPGAVITVRAGTYQGGLVIVKDLTLTGAGAYWTIISGSRWYGIMIAGQAQAKIHSLQISNNGVHGGIVVTDSAQATIENSQVSDNEYTGIHIVGDSSQAEIRGSIINGNGKAEYCKEKDQPCNGISIGGKSQVKLIGSKVLKNADWGVGAYLKQCGSDVNFFTGHQVTFEDMMLEDISGNNTTGNHDGMGNPGNHPWNRPDVPDGQVCLP